MKKPTIKQQVLKHLKENGFITNFHCIDNRITTRLSDVIFNLKKEGFDITTDIQKDKNCIYRMKPKRIERTYIPVLGKEIIKPIYK